MARGRASSTRTWLAQRVADAAAAGHELELVRCREDGSVSDRYVLNRVKARCKGCGWDGRVKRGKEGALMSAMIHVGEVVSGVEEVSPEGVSVPGVVGPHL